MADVVLVGGGVELEVVMVLVDGVISEMDKRIGEISGVRRAVGLRRETSEALSIEEHPERVDP